MTSPVNPPYVRPQTKVYRPLPQLPVIDETKMIAQRAQRLAEMPPMQRFAAQAKIPFSEPM